MKFIEECSNLIQYAKSINENRPVTFYLKDLIKSMEADEIHLPNKSLHTIAWVLRELIVQFTIRLADKVPTNYVDTSFTNAMSHAAQLYDEDIDVITIQSILAAIGDGDFFTKYNMNQMKNEGY